MKVLRKGFIVVFLITSLIALWLLIFPKYPSITSTVIDAETGKPIEGAVILVEWTTTGGIPGLYNTSSYKVFEALSDNEGKVVIKGVYNPIVDVPDIAVYKKGYVAWSDKIIFPDWNQRTDFKWKDNSVFRLERFKEGYSYIAHEDFITSGINVGLGTETKQFFLKTYRAAEEDMVIRERNRNNK